jgi:hypothetical protein
MSHDNRIGGPASRAGDQEVQLAVMVPRHVKRAVRRKAEADGLTLRGLLLRLLKQAGIADIKEDDVLDRRVAAAQLRTRTHRDAGES